MPASPADALHRQSPPVSVVTGSGDTMLPRVPAVGRRVALVINGQVWRHTKDRLGIEPVTVGGDPRNPSISLSGITVAWDDDCPLCTPPGRQVFKLDRGLINQVTNDPSGTSRNPSLSARGSMIVFESRGDLVGGTPAVGPQQVFVQGKDGSIVQVSRGTGTSGNASISRSGRHVAFESTSHPLTGADTGITQVWVSTLLGTTVLTDGLAPSGLPAISGDGRFVAFESRAALASGPGASDTGVTQIFGRDLTTGTRYRITNAAGGCSGASVDDVGGDWRVGFTCGGVGYVHSVRSGQRFRLPISGGDTAQAAVELGTHFVLVSTTGDVGFGPTPGHQVYVLNLFKLPPTPVPSDAAQY
jgi:hypothetical protein